MNPLSNHKRGPPQYARSRAIRRRLSMIVGIVLRAAIRNLLPSRVAFDAYRIREHAGAGLAPAVTPRRASDVVAFLINLARLMQIANGSGA